MRWWAGAACVAALWAATGCRQVVGADDNTFFAACIPGTTTPCYSGPEGTAGVGACKAGTRVCLDDGSAFGPCEGEVTPKPIDDCATAADTTCDGNPPAACTGEPQWARTLPDTEGYAVSAPAGVQAEPIVDFAAGATQSFSNPDGSTSETVGAYLVGYESDGDAWAKTFLPFVTRALVAVGVDGYAAGFTHQGIAASYDTGKLFIAKLQPDTFVAGWEMTTEISADRDVAVGARGTHVVAIATTSDEIAAADFPGATGAVPTTPFPSEGRGVVVVRASALGQITGVALLGGASDQIARGVDVASDGSVVVTGCFLERADFAGDCPLQGAADTWDGFVARLDADLKCVEATRVEMGVAGSDDCHVRAKFDDAGDLYWAAASSGANAAKLEAHREGESGWDWASDVSGGASDSARLSVTAVALDIFGNLLLTGDFGGGVGLDAKVESAAMEGKGWVAKLASTPGDAQLLWLRAIAVSPPLSDGVRPTAITADEQGWVYVGGNSEGTLDLPDPQPTSADASFLTRLQP